MKNKDVKILSAALDIVVVFISALLAQFLITWEALGYLFAPQILWLWIAFNAVLFVAWLNAFGLYSISLSSISLIEAVKFFFVNVIVGNSVSFREDNTRKKRSQQHNFTV